MKYQNIYQMLSQTVNDYGQEAAYFECINNSWREITWKELKEQADFFALSLLSHGFKANDKVSILASNDIVWPIADIGTIAAGGVGVGIYPSSSPDQCAYILNHSKSKFVVVDTHDQLQKILKIKDQVPSLEGIISKRPHPEAISWQEFLQPVNKDSILSLEKNALARDFEDTVVIVYTSGTTGHPKGACLSNRYIISSCEALDKIFDAMKESIAYKKLTDTKRLTTLSFLPFCHVAERISGMYARMYSGFSAYLVDNVAKLYTYMLELNPHIFGGLPRFYEKIYAKIISDIEEGLINKNDVTKAIEVSKKVRECNHSQIELSQELQNQQSWAEENVYSKIRSYFGTRIVSCSSGAAPIPKEVLDFFALAGDLIILEAYGLTEFVCCAFNTFQQQKANSVGKPMFGCQINIAEDGEILLKGPQMFTSYYENEEATREMIDAKGWLHTGDIGKLDEDGFLFITGRKKEFIKTSTGKKIAPLYIENICKRSHLLSNVMVYGDNKKYLVALLTLNEIELKAYAKIHNISYSSYENLVNHTDIRTIIDNVVKDTNSQVSSTEQIKKYTVLPRDFSIEEDEITPTGKVKRKNVSQKYQDIIEKMYS